MAGLGLAGVMAGLSGAASVCMSDRSEKAVELALAACAANSVAAEVSGMVSDWSERSLPGGPRLACTSPCTALHRQHLPVPYFSLPPTSNHNILP